jgi:hypothetical protein
VKKIREGVSGPKKANWRFLINITTMKIKAPSQAIFSIAAKRLDVLVTSIAMRGRKRKVAAIYGARQAMQKYVSKLVGGRLVTAKPSRGQLWVEITDAAST